MRFDWGHWFMGLVAALITGGAGSITTTGAAGWIAPESFNIAGGFHKTMLLFGSSFIINGVIGAAAYLKQSPVPTERPPREVWTDEQRAAAAATACHHRSHTQGWRAAICAMTVKRRSSAH